MMPVWCELVCNECSRSGVGRHVITATIPRKDMRLAAIKSGWAVIKREWYCPQCARAMAVKRA